MDNQNENTVCSLFDFWPALCIIAVAALIVGIIIGALLFKKETPGNFMEKLITILSGFFVVGAIVFQTVGLMESFSIIVTTIFTSVVFSWLLTRVSGKKEWQEREQELALRSYRHIDYIESASKTAEQAINQYIADRGEGEITPEQKLVLSRAMDYIGYIHGGIRTCKMDWYDLMSQEGQSRFSPLEATDQIVDINNVSINQEDA